MQGSVAQNGISAEHFYLRPIMKINDVETISSKDNSRLKFARGVRDGRELGLMFVEGLRLTRELVSTDTEIVSALVSDDVFASSQFSELEKRLSERSVAITKVAGKVFDSIADTENSQGIVLIAKCPVHSLGDVAARVRDGIFVYLNRVNNPSNLGAVVRTAEAAGAAAVICSHGSANAFSPKAIRASMGSAFRLPIVREIGFSDAIEWANRSGIRTAAADIRSSSVYTDIDWKGSRMLVFGSEANGLEAAELERIDETLLIPMENGVESLNLAVSAGIILFEAKRQRS